NEVARGRCPSWWRCTALSRASRAEQLRKTPPATASTSCTPPDPRGGASVLVEFAQHDPGEHMGDGTITRRCTFDSTQSIADLNQPAGGFEQIRAAELPPVVVHHLNLSPDPNHTLIASSRLPRFCSGLAVRRERQSDPLLTGLR